MNWDKTRFCDVVLSIETDKVTIGVMVIGRSLLALLATLRGSHLIRIPQFSCLASGDVHATSGGTSVALCAEFAEQKRKSEGFFGLFEWHFNRV
jgi:hypothetical protein